MKYTHIIALKQDFEPHYIKIRIGNDISHIGRYYYRAYIFETKKQAIETWNKWYDQYLEKQKEK